MQPPDVKNRRTPPTCMVIGGGWAGIAAAVAAAERGFAVTLVEERPYLGGRARSFVDRTTGDVVDNGQHVMMGCYHALRTTLASLGTDGLLAGPPALQVLFADMEGTRDELRTQRLPGVAGMALGLLGLRRISWSGRMAILRLMLRLRRGPLDTAGRSCADVLAAYGQPADAVTRFWEPVVLATLNAPLDQAAASLLETVLRQAFFAGREASRLLVPVAGLSALVEPLDGVLAAAGGCVVRSTAVERLEIEHNRVVGVDTSDGSRHRPDHVVLAVPPWAVQRLLPAGLRPAVVDALDMSPIVSVYLWYDRPWLDADVVATLGGTVQWVFNRRTLAHAPADVVVRYPGHVALTVSAADDLVGRTSEEIIAVCVDELASLLPASRGATLLHGLVVKERRATVRITAAVERQRSVGLRPYHNLYVVGDWTGTGLPATLEGAARSGREAVLVMAAATTGEGVERHAGR